MKTKLMFLCIMIFAACRIAVFADENEMLKSAETLYEKGDYKNAADNYIKVAEREGTSAELLYNIGNCYYLSGDLGHSRLFYERSRKLDPKNKLVNNNLDFVANTVNDANEADRHGKKLKVTPDEISFFAGIDRAISYNNTSNYWSIYALLSFLLLLSSVSLYIFSGNVNARKAGFFGSLIFLFFSIVFVIFSFMAARRFESHDEGILVEYKIDLRQEPSADAEVVGTPLNQGTKFRIMEEEKDSQGKILWYKVRLNSEIEGWIPGPALEVI